jgi:hypothetical protein
MNKIIKLHNLYYIVIAILFLPNLTYAAVVSKSQLVDQNQNCMDFYVIDENKEICSQQGTGIWVSGFYYPSNPEKGGKIEIPYQTSY